MPLFPVRAIAPDQAGLADSVAEADWAYLSGAHVWRSLVIALTGLIGVCASFALFVAINGWQAHVEDIRFSSLARDHLQFINAGLQDATDLLYSMRAYFESLDHRPSLTEYRAFSESLREHTVGMRDTGWAPRVTAAEREAFEQRMRTSSFPDYQIQERGPDGKLARAAERAEYFPIIYTDPVKTARAVAGYDLISESLRRQAVSIPWPPASLPRPHLSHWCPRAR